MNDANYPWFILVPRREEVSELFQLDAADQRSLLRETSLLAEVIKDTFKADKMNIATLGNVVAQLHMHVVARRRDDASWPGPARGRHPAQPYTEGSARANCAPSRWPVLTSEDFRFARRTV